MNRTVTPRPRAAGRFGGGRVTQRFSGEPTHSCAPRQCVHGADPVINRLRSRRNSGHTIPARQGCCKLYSREEGGGPLAAPESTRSRTAEMCIVIWYIVQNAAKRRKLLCDRCLSRGSACGLNRVGGALSTAAVWTRLLNHVAEPRVKVAMFKN